MAKKAFIIGVNTQGLQYAQHDEALIQECLGKYGFDICTPDTIDKWKILKQFEQWVKNCNKTDTCIFYFSGHGMLFKGKLRLVLHHDELDIYHITSSFEKCKAIAKLIILDCCHAGASHADWTPDPSDAYRLLTASDRLEKSKELDEFQASFLTYCFHQTLLNPPHIIIDEDNIIRLDKFYDWLKKRSQEHNAKPHAIQVPIPNLLGNRKIDIELALVEPSTPPSLPRNHIVPSDEDFYQSAKQSQSSNRGQESKLGELVSKMCNRKRQQNDFHEFFSKKSEKCPHRPQFYFIHGEEDECHGSLVERLFKTEIKEYVENKKGKQHANTCLLRIPWPDPGNLKKEQRDLQMGLFQKGSHGTYCDSKTAFSINSLSQIRHIMENHFVVITHDIYVSQQWNKYTRKLLCWYIKEYWAALECHENWPQFVIFINIKYPKNKKVSWKERIFGKKYNRKKYIEKQLSQISQTSEDNCPCQVLGELKPLEKRHVEQWFHEYIINSCMNESGGNQKIDAIFADNNHGVSMKFIETILKKIVLECTHKSVRQYL